MRYRSYVLGLIVASILPAQVLAQALDRSIQFRHERRRVDRYDVHAMWDASTLGEERLLYLLVIPLGDVVLFQGALSDRLTTTGNTPCVGVSPVGLYLNAVKVPNSDKGRIWMLRTSTQTIEETTVPGKFDGDFRLTPTVFGRLEQTDVWKQCLKPAADEESEAFKKFLLKRTFGDDE